MSVTNEKTPAIARERFVDPQRKQCGRVSNPCRPCRPSSCPSLSCPCRELLVNLEPRNVERTRNDSRSPSDPSIVSESRAAATAFAAGRTKYFLQGNHIAFVVERDCESADVDDLPWDDLPFLRVPAKNATCDSYYLGRFGCSDKSVVGRVNFFSFHGFKFALIRFLQHLRLDFGFLLFQFSKLVFVSAFAAWHYHHAAALWTALSTGLPSVLCHGCFHLLPLVPRDRPTYAARCAHPISASLVPQVKFVSIHAADSTRPAGCRPLPPLLAI